MKINSECLYVLGGEKQITEINEQRKDFKIKEQW
jgi:hypothetical protein